MLGMCLERSKSSLLVIDGGRMLVMLPPCCTIANLCSLVKIAPGAGVAPGGNAGGCGVAWGYVVYGVAGV